MKGFNGFKSNQQYRTSKSDKPTPSTINLTGISNFNLVDQPNQYPANVKNHPAVHWSERQVISWLQENELEIYERVFLDNDVNGEVLMELNHSLLKMMNVSTVGGRVKILEAIKNLKRNSLASPAYNNINLTSNASTDFEKSPNSKHRFSPIDALFKKNRSIYVEPKPRNDTVPSSRANHYVTTPTSNNSYNATFNPFTNPHFGYSSTNNNHGTISEPFTNPNPYTNPSPPASPELQNLLRIYGSNGAIRMVDVSNVIDAPTLMAKILKCFSNEESPYRYAIFPVNGETTRSLNEEELMAICRHPEKSHREKLILRIEHQPMSHDGFLRAKARKHVGHRAEPSPTASTKQDKLTKIFGERPPSQLISSNLSQFFPDHDKQTTSPEQARIDTLQSLSARPRPRKDVASHENFKTEMVPFNDPTLNEKAPTKAPIHHKSLEDLSSKRDSWAPQPTTPIKQDIKCIKGAQLGSGSFGDVFLGLNPFNGQLMAIKQVILPSPSNNMAATQKSEKRLDALQKEIELLKALNHPNIVRYLGSQKSDDQLNILLEYVPGGSVSGQLSNYGPFTEPLVQRYVRQILTGLSFLHSQNIIHRDIKGGNILVDNMGNVKITDFGVSKKLQEEVLNTVTNQRASLQGSIYWMAPEVVKHTHYTQKADIWALGCLIIEMMTGRHPFPHFNQMQAIFKIGSDVCPEIPEHASPLAKDFINQTFTIDYESRPTAVELLHHPFLTGNHALNEGLM